VVSFALGAQCNQSKNNATGTIKSENCQVEYTCKQCLLCSDHLPVDDDNNSLNRTNIMRKAAIAATCNVICKFCEKLIINKLSFRS
jgi:hypothetical protein